MSVIEGLCKGHGCLDRTELTMFIDGIKQAKYPKNEETTSSVETTKTEFYGKLTRQGLLNTNQSFARYEGLTTYSSINKVSFFSNTGSIRVRRPPGKVYSTTEV